MWKSTKQMVKGYEGEPNSYADEDMNIVRSGMRFWEFLGLANPKLEKPRINIPFTFVNCNGSQQMMLWNDPITGRITCNMDPNYSEFEKTLVNQLEASIQIEPDRFTVMTPEEREKYIKQKHREILEEEKKKRYFFAMRKKNTDTDTSIDVYTFNKWAQGRSNLVQLDDNCLLQEYVYPRGQKACITRVVYHTKHSKDMKANYGFKLRNKHDLDYESDRHSTEEVATVCKGDESKINSFTVNRLSGVSLVDYEMSAEELVTFLERAYPVRINKIILDFITDKFKRNVLINVKYIDLEQTKASDKDVGEKKRTLDELTCSVYCKLCGLIFKKDEASKTLTYKLLWELAQHLKKRGRSLKGIEVSHSSTRPCRVCDLCYMVVVSEHELIELEQQFARVQNIPITDPYLRVPIEKKAKHRPALLSENLKQWRFMLYLQNLYFEAENLFETNKVNTSDIHLQIKLSRIKNDFTLNLDIPLDKEQTGSVNPEFDYTYAYEINLLRVYYFFSESTDIKTFLNETEVQVRLTHTSDWNNYIAQGSTRTLAYFQNGRIRGQKHESRIYMFFDSADYCTLKFMAGLVCDGDFNTASMNLHKYNGIYFPNDDFYNCNIFPEEWIEIFMADGDKYELEDYDTQEKKVQPYTPVCTQAELKKMLEPNHRSTKYSDIETRIDNKLDKTKYEYDKERIRQERMSKRSRPFSNYTALEEAPMPREFRIKADISKPQTADPRKGKNSGRERSADLNRGMKTQVKNYLEQHQDKTIIGQPGKTIRQELFDESEVYMGLEDEYGTNKDTEGKRRLVSAQDHKQFLAKQQQLLKDDRKAY